MSRTKNNQRYKNFTKQIIKNNDLRAPGWGNMDVFFSIKDMKTQVKAFKINFFSEL